MRAKKEKDDVTARRKSRVVSKLVIEKAKDAPISPQLSARFEKIQKEMSNAAARSLPLNDDVVGGLSLPVLSPRVKQPLSPMHLSPTHAADPSANRIRGKRIPLPM